MKPVAEINRNRRDKQKQRYHETHQAAPVSACIDGKQHASERGTDGSDPHEAVAAESSHQPRVEQIRDHDADNARTEQQAVKLRPLAAIASPMFPEFTFRPRRQSWPPSRIYCRANLRVLRLPLLRRLRLRLLILSLGGVLLRLLAGHVMADSAAPCGASHCVTLADKVSGYSTGSRTLHTSCRVCFARNCQ
jgi:hypothetical protein